MQTIHQLYYEWNFVNDLETKNKWLLHDTTWIIGSVVDIFD
jgi:hypothetical protein